MGNPADMLNGLCVEAESAVLFFGGLFNGGPVDYGYLLTIVVAQKLIYKQISDFFSQGAKCSFAPLNHIFLTRHSCRCVLPAGATNPESLLEYDAGTQCDKTL